MEQTPALAPVPPSERIRIIDVLRGAALFGILAANMRGFAAPFAVYMEPFKMWSDAPNLTAQFLIDLLISGKFITIFAVLFGIGFAIQMDRAALRGQNAWFYLRRMAVLMLIGAVHSFGVWWGDILMSYAAAGPMLLLFRRTSDRGLLRWALALYCVMPALMVVGMIASMAGAEMPHPPETTAEEIAETVRIYSQGSVLEIFRERAREWTVLNSFAAFFLPRVLALFLAGVWLWRRGLIVNAEGHLDWWRRARTIGLAAGLPLSLAAVGVQYVLRPNIMEPNPASVAMMLAGSIAMPLLSLFYASTLVVLFHTKREWKTRLTPFTYVGRMALTNYLLQSVIGTTLCYAYGAGLYGKMGPLLGLIPTVVVYGAQIQFSRWWLGKNDYGPAEWLWRKLTYPAPGGRSVTAPSA
ncbi:MAG: DUF418 domain-containing protein [Bryobacteraceae bacterium]